MKKVVIDGETYCCLEDTPSPTWCCHCDNECSDEFSFGSKAIGLHQLSPLCDPEVRDIKEYYADIIDLLNDARETHTNYENKRLYSVAITEAETACMWAVKALTSNN